MSYKCQKCKEQVPRNVPAHRVVTARRYKTYPGGSVGEEIVKELLVCASCKQGFDETDHLR